MPRIYHKPLVVGPESIDAVGHVNNREYLRWMEEVAVEHSNAQGWPMERYFADQTAWFAASHFVEYLRPAHAGDSLDIYTWITPLGRKQLPAALRGAAPAQARGARRDDLDLCRPGERTGAADCAVRARRLLHGRGR